MNEEGVKKLAELSRLELTDAEIAEYAGEFSDILGYVDSLKDAVENSDEDLILESASNRNVVREDENPHESGINTENIIEEAPDSQEDYIKVKKVL
jgi:aspartyl-tRNA(Asn)/glutamyl-tRNA(Gln) amidotransferase subunit C